MAHARHAPSRPQILLVDDDLLLRRVLALNLARRGFRVVETASGACAREALLTTHDAGYPFDRIILETSLGDRSGWDLLTWLRSPEWARRGLIMPPIVAMSALPITRSHLTSCAPPGPCESPGSCAPVTVLRKPFSIEALLVASGLRQPPPAGVPAGNGRAAHQRHPLTHSRDMPSRTIETVGQAVEQ